MLKIILRIVAGVLSAFAAVLFHYLFHPAWNLQSSGFWFYMLGVAGVSAIIFAVAEYIAYKFDDCTFIGTIICSIVAGVILVVLMVGGLTSSHLFNANRYHNMISIEEGSFSEDISNIEEQIKLISIVDVDTARRLGDRTVGSIKNATWYEVDSEYNLIKYKGEYYRISALNYGGLFKYNKAKEFGIPGYVLVNVSTQEAQYVELDNPIKYSPSAHYGEKLTRYLRNKFPSYIFGTSFFEIDEEGIPYYITSVQRPTIGMFGGKKEDSFILTNASNGEYKEYATNELPDWVDHAFDLAYLMRVVENNKTYVNGFWNTVFSKTGIFHTTYHYKGDGFAGYNTAIASNGDVVFYTGITSGSAAESNNGFILANPRTGNVVEYAYSGAEESSAQMAAQGLVQNLNYYATFPTILNVDGVPTYFMLLKDNAGLVQRYALCNIKDYTKVVQAADLKTAIKLYKEKLNGKDFAEGATDTVEGTIEKIYTAEIDGCTYYYFTFEGSDNLYMSSIKNSNKQVLLTEGMKISIEYYESDENGVFIITKITF